MRENLHGALHPPVLVAVATDKYLSPKHPFPDTAELSHLLVPDHGVLRCKPVVPRYGQDLAFGYGRKIPGGAPAGGKDGSVLEQKMRVLLREFASNDKTGMAKRLYGHGQASV